MLAQGSLAAMMAHCGWKCLQSVFHYVIRDNMDEDIKAQMLADVSDEDK